MSGKTSLNCFFCGKEIAALKQSETRRAKGDHYESDTYYEFVTVTSNERDVVSLNFVPSYRIDLEKVIESAVKEIKDVLRKTGETIGLTVSINGLVGLEYYRKRAQELFELRSLKYEVPEVNRIVPEGFKAHAICLKPALTLEELSNNIYVKKQFEDSLNSLPKPMQQIYNIFKKESVAVVVNSQDYLSGGEKC